MSTATIDFEMNFQDNQQSEADKRLYVHFYKDATKNEFKSREAGRPIFDEFDYVKVITPGSRDTIVTRVADGSDYARRFPAAWARYKAGQEQGESGTPLSQLPWMSVGQVAELSAVGCKTVEQLVGMPDVLSQKFMGHHQLKQRAQVYLEASKNAAPALKLQAELEKRDLQIAELQAQVATLVASKPQQPQLPPKA
jgi:hypothetical protein